MYALVFPHYSFLLLISFPQADYVYQEMSSRSLDDIRSTSALVATSDLNSILRLFGLDEVPGGENMLPSASSTAAQPSPAAAESKST